MKIAPMRKVRNNLTRHLAEAEDEPIFVTRNGKVTAVIEHIEDSEIEDYLLERSPRFRAMLDKVTRERKSLSLSEYRKSRGI
jgi:PHD/YefM family antitoxin component YafN of YafNO toxin-antitoxin module